MSGERKPPAHELEVDLKKMGCPYDADDRRVLPWLDGYKAGYCAGIDTGVAALERLTKA